MRKVIVFVILFVSHNILAQIPISNTANSMRTGDVLRKLRVNYVGSGDAGTHKVWTMGKIENNSKEFIQGIVCSGDTIAVFEKGIIHHYLLHGDTLCYKGNQQRRSYLLYNEERLFVRYPFAYGDSISCDYSGSGIDENHEISVTGWGSSVVDGTGILTDGEFTLQPVTRIHLFDDYLERYDNQTEIHMRCNRFLWYCSGYRYPVMESIYRSTLENGGIEVPLDSATYLYLPVQQSDLNEDAANDSILNYLAGIAGQQDYSQPTSASSFNFVQAVLSSDGSSLSVSYSLLSDSKFSIRVYDVMGYLLGSFYCDNKAAGDWEESITLHRKPIANVLMISIQCNGETTSLKVNY